MSDLGLALAKTKTEPVFDDRRRQGPRPKTTNCCWRFVEMWTSNRSSWNWPRQLLRNFMPQCRPPAITASTSSYLSQQTNSVRSLTSSSVRPCFFSSCFFFLQVSHQPAVTFGAVTSPSIHVGTFPRWCFLLKLTSFITVSAIISVSVKVTIYVSVKLLLHAR